MLFPHMEAATRPIIIVMRHDSPSVNCYILDGVDSSVHAASAKSRFTKQHVLHL